MGVLFHILSTGGSTGASRATRYIAERDKNLEREGPGSRPLFSEDRDGLSYRHADRILDPVDGRPEKNDLIHFSVMIDEESFDKLGADEKERQARFREVIRDGMKGMAEELNVERLTWVGGIHRNSENPHAHVVMQKHAFERGSGRETRIGRIRKSLLPHKEMKDGQEVLVPGRIGERFLAALEKHQDLYLTPNHEQARAQAAWEELVERIQKSRAERAERHQSQPREERQAQSRDERTPDESARGSRLRTDRSSIAASWNDRAPDHDQDYRDFRLTLGRQLEFSTRLAFAQVWYERAVNHGDTYRFNVVDQTTSEERKISKLDVHRRAAARSQRAGGADRVTREQVYETDLSRHRETLDQLSEAREAKIASLGKDVSSLSRKLGKVEQGIARLYETPPAKDLTPILHRQTLSELQDQAVRLNLPDKVWDLEKVRMDLAREFHSPSRSDEEAATLVAQLNVGRADLMAKDARIENFEASVHLTSYEVGQERWSLAAIDKQIARRQDDAKLIPQRAARLDLRSLTRLNYSSAVREQASADVEHLTHVRGEIVRQIERRREPLLSDRQVAGEMVDVLERIYRSEEHARARDGKVMPDPKYERHQINSLETSAENLRDPKLLREVNEWEKSASKQDGEINWEGRAVAREITSQLAVQETRERLQHFLESKRVASLHIGNHRTGNLREVEARTLTEYLARAIESREQRDFRHTVKLAAREHHDHLVTHFEKASDYHEAARGFASEAKDRDPQFTDKEKINLEIYAERQNDEAERERYLELARGEGHAQEHEASVARSR